MSTWDHMVASYTALRTDVLGTGADVVYGALERFRKMGESEFLRAAGRAILAHDLCSREFGQRWPLVENVCGDFSTGSVKAFLSDRTEALSLFHRSSKYQWYAIVVGAIDRIGWGEFQKGAANDGGCFLHSLPGMDIVGGFVALRDSLFPSDASPRPLLTAMARGKIAGKVDGLIEVHRALGVPHGDVPSVVDLVLLRGAVLPGWEDRFRYMPAEVAGKSNLHELSYRVNRPKSVTMKGPAHESSQKSRSVVRKPAPYRYFRAGY